MLIINGIKIIIRLFKSSNYYFMNIQKGFLNKYLISGLCVSSLFLGCTKLSQTKPSPNGTYQVSIEGSLSVNTTFSGSCDKVHAVYYPLDPVYQNLRSILIQGTDLHQQVGITIYFIGSYPTNPSFKLGGTPPSTDLNMWGYAVYTQDINNSANSYNTDDDDAGTLTITAYDQTNQTLSGTYQFAAQGYDNGATLAGVHATISGSFTNVPINDLSDPNNPKGPCFSNSGASLGGGSTSGIPPGSTTNTTINYQNNSFTDISITVNNLTQIIHSKGIVSFVGASNSLASGTANTSGKTSSGTQVGLLISWNINNTFPATGATTISFDIPSTYFFLNIANNSSYTVQKVYVNYGLLDQTLDNITFGSGTFGIGYYKAYSNSNVRCESNSTYWSISSLSLPNTINQSTTITLSN
jgi:Family of unknown function (DUF6252)